MWELEWPSGTTPRSGKSSLTCYWTLPNHRWWMHPGLSQATSDSKHEKSLIFIKSCVNKESVTTGLEWASWTTHSAGKYSLTCFRIEPNRLSWIGVQDMLCASKDANFEIASFDQKTVLFQYRAQINFSWVSQRSHLFRIFFASFSHLFRIFFASFSHLLRTHITIFASFSHLLKSEYQDNRIFFASFSHLL